MFANSKMRYAGQRHAGQRHAGQGHAEQKHAGDTKLKEAARPGRHRVLSMFVKTDYLQIRRTVGIAWPRIAYANCSLEMLLQMSTGHEGSYLETILRRLQIATAVMQDCRLLTPRRGCRSTNMRSVV